ncbi:tape measure protein [Alkaliphilus sp. MSJ-5]|uniref:Tape measure protein n=1 Tax=Alkaliphilus flagellatus TaxID=2841507 RepID=A0ABS6G2P7_9FIRM|nr:tape measure protein [Alkaliphilus flagellatus]MBU5676750.1 tape measure protein [Alkaliphilus flagellatus]
MATVDNSISLHNETNNNYLRLSNSINNNYLRLSNSINNTSTRLYNTVNNNISNNISNFYVMEQYIIDASAAQQDLNEDIEEGQNAADGLLNIFKGMAGTIGLDFSVENILALSDQMATTKASLASMVGEFNTVEELQKKIFQSAERSRGSYLAMADVVAKMGTMAKDAFGGNDEIIAFTEQLNKHFVISGTSAQDIDSIMSQLTQSMAQGVLSDEELSSIFIEVPTIIQAIAGYIGIGTEEVINLAQEGQITADIFKNAMFGAANETNAALESMPMTWAQIFTSVINKVIMLSQPLLGFISFLAQNWATVEPIVVGVATAIGLLAAKVLYAKAAALAIAAMANPLVPVAVVIGVIIMEIYKWVQSVGGLQIAWLITMNAIMTAWDGVKIGFFKGIYFVMNLFDKLGLKFKEVDVAMQNSMGDMRVGVLSALQKMVNGSIEIINSFIDKVNQLPIVSIEAVQKVNFATTAELENDVAKKAREADLENYRAEVEASIAERDAAIKQMQQDAGVEEAKRQLKINAAQMEQTTDFNPEPPFKQDNVVENIANIADNTNALKDTMEIAEEDLTYMRDLAEREVIDRTVLRDVKLEVSNSFGDVRETADVDGIITRIEERLSEAIESEAEGDYNV